MPVQGEFGPVPLPVDPATLRVQEIRKRRRDILVTLLWVMGATLVLGLVPGFRSLLWLHVVTDLLFAAYVTSLVRMKKQAALQREADRKAAIRELHRQVPNVTDLALRRAAGD